MKTPLYTALVNHADEHTQSFHVPGHHNGDVFFDEARAFFQSILKIDVTELTGLDDLHDPSGVIKKAQDLTASLYGAKETFFLVNGSTVGNLAMILSVCQPGDVLLVQRNCHKSVFHAIELSGAHPVFLTPEIDEKMAVATHLLHQTVKDAILRYPSAKALMITSPNYYGHAVDLTPIITEAHQHHIPVLVDEAHGAHFVLGGSFPQSSLQAGADAVVQSAHKTLPAMTMGSYLHLNSGRIDRDKLAHYLTVLQSSSPSYPIMASLDLARAYLEKIMKANKIEQIEKEIQDMKQSLLQMKGIEIIVPTDPLIQQDPLKLSIRSKYGHSGYELKNIFETNGWHPELADERQVLFVLPPGGKSKLTKELIRKIEKEMKQTSAEPSNETCSMQPLEKVTTLPYSSKKQSAFKTESVSFRDAVGRVSAEQVIPYPPGIPLIMAGERVTKGVIHQLAKLIDLNAYIQGSSLLKNKQLMVYIEEEKL
ncbi:aminotransferase class I/II-fold pyridoxal phosphate-dependent enzyme [Bacillus changyiensis]|uniref:aminotransferase class I/II-fold pyridoxal phosphate-dependent enzyme n=1 Tax=Bacillus changyiensis TaxID=3004103 RepID=UPI0022E41719|nr:aminotransferase class I/II-fold pyridoxal phosphate-dependent enzyme [Bacillus changyiensis]MDA1478242.1 aminotransferase class I/II-fold pyridoxal phosphate-dependent enzyme [Bacillus changyiensis]